VGFEIALARVPRDASLWKMHRTALARWMPFAMGLYLYAAITAAHAADAEKASVTFSIVDKTSGKPMLQFQSLCREILARRTRQCERRLST
jgi:hypothetical protein